MHRPQWFHLLLHQLWISFGPRKIMQRGIESVRPPALRLNPSRLPAKSPLRMSQKKGGLHRPLQPLLSASNSTARRSCAHVEPGTGIRESRNPRLAPRHPSPTPRATPSVGNRACAARRLENGDLVVVAILRCNRPGFSPSLLVTFVKIEWCGTRGDRASRVTLTLNSRMPGLVNSTPSGRINPAAALSHGRAFDSKVASDFSKRAPARESTSRRRT